MAKNKVMSGEPNSLPTPSHIYQLPGLNERLQSFYTFEKIFAHCLSHTAVQTRFSEPVKSVQSISEEFSASFNRNIELCTEQKIYQQQCLTEWKRRKVLTDQISKDLEKETSKKINLVVKYTEDFLIKAMHDEVNRITTFINEFRWIFDDKDPKTLQEYKTKLFKHVRDCLRVNITTKCSENIHRQVREIDEKMIQGLGDVQNISDTGMADQKLDQAPPCADTVLFEESPLDDDIFSKSFIVDAKSIGADFQEDLTFRFSLGLSKLMVRLQKSQNKNLNMVGNALVPLKDLTDTVPTSRESFAMVATKIAINGTPQITTALTIGYGAYKVMGWRMLAFVGGAYTSLYVWERTMWNTRAKERALKKQFAEHAQGYILRRKNDTAEEASQVLDSSLKLRHDVLKKNLEKIGERIDNEVCTVQTKIQDLDRIQSFSKVLRNKSDWIGKSLNDFASKYFDKTFWEDAKSIRSEKEIE